MCDSEDSLAFDDAWKTAPRAVRKREIAGARHKMSDGMLAP